VIFIIIITGIFPVEKYNNYYFIVTLSLTVILVLGIPIYTEIMERGILYKKGTVDRHYSKQIYWLKRDYKFKIDKNTVDGSRYVSGLYRDYFINLYLWKEGSDFKARYKIVTFGFYKYWEELDKKIIIRDYFYDPKKNEFYKPHKEDLIKSILYDIEHFQENDFK